MPRYKLIIEYNGAPYAGWQRQKNAETIQGALERAFHAFCGGGPRVFGAGRTDSGVHACGQVAHVDLPRAWSPHTIWAALNAHLFPQPIVILGVETVPESFDARLTAIQRHYCYRILNRPTWPGLARGFVWHVAKPLDASAMQKAAQILVGHHDFTSFRNTRCQAKSPLKTLDAFTVTCVGDEILCHTTSRSFLHNQVRSMVGCLKLVGEGVWSEKDLEDVLQARDRKACGTLAPVDGLYLMQVTYPKF